MKDPLVCLASLFLLLLLSILNLASAADNYIPADDIAVDCGADTTGTPIGDDRIWESDATSKFLQPQQGAASSSKFLQPSTDLQNVPYRTARLSRSPFTYSFPVTPGQKFIRLHFFPETYPPDFPKPDASFSVRAGRFTLLNNFSADLHTRALQKQDGLLMEFCLNVEPNQLLLNLTFAPTPGVAAAYAFINGIEVVSMPTNLYYTQADAPGLPAIGLGNRNLLRRVGNDTALQLMHRVDVAGGSIAPKDDTGMYRRWDPDDDYFVNNAPSAIYENSSIQFNYKDGELYRNAAPDLVYRTARGMSNDSNVNLEYNLTWRFPVDPSFTYFVRLHFCEFQPPINAQDNRAFHIYIANETAKLNMDVIREASGNGFPIFDDFLAMIQASEDKNQAYLYIALYPFERGSAYVNAILNGVEIYKLSSSDNLAGPNPDLPPPPLSSPPLGPSSRKNRTKLLAAIAAGVVSGLIALLLLVFMWKRKVRNYSDGDAASASTSTWFEKFSSYSGTSKEKFSSYSGTSNSKYSSSTLPSDLCRRFSVAEIKSATRDFDKAFIIGAGGFGNVYKGQIHDGAAMATVAIKRLNPESQQGANEFKTEIEMLSQLRHVHLVSLIGYCYDDGEMILVYDYMSNSTLQDHLYKTQNPPIPWKQRLEICIGAARGLHYLHSGAKNTIIHRDVKTTNILLDDKWVAKVSDFGLSKIGPGAPDAHVSTVVKGSFGYLDPEYYRLQRLTEKSDVYSFGVVLWEVLSARPSINRSGNNKKAVSLAELAMQHYRSGRVKEMVDRHLDGQIAAECLKKFAEVAMSCLGERGVDRPSMGDVVWALEFAMELQGSGDEDVQLSGKGDEKEMPLMNANSGNSSSVGGSDMFSINSEIVFGSKMNGLITTTSASSTTADQLSSLSHGSSESPMMTQSDYVFSEILDPKPR